MNYHEYQSNWKKVGKWKVNIGNWAIILKGNYKNDVPYGIRQYDISSANWGSWSKNGAIGKWQIDKLFRFQWHHTITYADWTEAYWSLKNSVRIWRRVITRTIRGTQGVEIWSYTNWKKNWIREFTHRTWLKMNVEFKNNIIVKH